MSICVWWQSSCYWCGILFPYSVSNHGLALLSQVSFLPYTLIWTCTPVFLALNLWLRPVPPLSAVVCPIILDTVFFVCLSVTDSNSDPVVVSVSVGLRISRSVWMLCPSACGHVSPPCPCVSQVIHHTGGGLLWVGPVGSPLSSNQR